MSSYEKQLEAQNEELRQKLAEEQGVVDMVRSMIKVREYDGGKHLLIVVPTDTPMIAQVTFKTNPKLKAFFDTLTREKFPV
jgi:hypothetical protein